MQTLFSIFLSLFISFILLTGCNETFDNTLQKEEQDYTIRMAPSFAAGASTTIPVNSRLILLSSAHLNPNTVTEQSIYIEDVNGIRYSAEITLSNLNIIINPIIYLQPSTAYEVVLTTKIEDLQGLHLSKETRIPFSTGTSIDSSPPTLTTTLPFDNASSYDTDAYSLIYFQFNETLAPMDLDSSRIRVYAFNEADKTGILRQSGSLLYFQPDQNLSASITYTVELNTSGIKDLSSNSYVDTNITISFSVKQVDIIPIKSPVLGVDSLSTSSTIYTIEESEGLLFLGGDSGLHMFDFNSSTERFSALSHLSSTSLGTVYSLDINAASHIIYVGSSKGLFIIDYTELSSPKVLGTFLTQAPVYGLHNSVNNTFLAGSTSGIYHINTSDLNHPQLITNFNTSGIAYDVQESGGDLIVADYHASIKTYSYTGNLVGLDPYLQTHVRQIEPNGVDYYFGTGIGGIVHWAKGNSTPFFEKRAASYITKVVDGNGSFIYANVSRIGIANFELATSRIKEYFTFPFQVHTFTHLINATNTQEYLILVSNSGTLHSMRLP